MKRIAVCDDNLDFLHHAVGLIRTWAAQSAATAQIYTFQSGDTLLQKHAAMHMDIIFLDILMPMQNGLETAKELRKNDTAAKLIFLTSSPEFALASYDVKADGYLLKPVCYEKIKETLDACSTAFDAEPKNTAVRTQFGYQKLYFQDIEFIEAQNKKCIFYLKGGRSVASIDPLHTIEARFLSNDGFFKCHRSYLVYLPNVDHFNTTELVTKAGRAVPIARGFGKAFQEAYFARMFQESGESE